MLFKVREEWGRFFVWRRVKLSQENSPHWFKWNNWDAINSYQFGDEKALFSEAKGLKRKQFEFCLSQHTPSKTSSATRPLPGRL